MNDVSKLPKWAQDHIATLKRERDVAVRELNQWCDSQTRSEFVIDEHVCTGESQGPSRKLRFIQTRRIKVVAFGVEAEISLDDSWKAIQIRYSQEDSHGDVALMPTAYMGLRLVHPKNLRTL